MARRFSTGPHTAPGRCQARSAFSATTKFKVDLGKSNGDSLTLAFNTLYNRASSLGTITGNYTAVSTSIVFADNGSRVVFARNAATGCVLDGQVAFINPRYNAYDVSVSYASCNGIDGVLNDATITGLGPLDNTVSPEQAKIELSGTADGTKVALVETLDRSELCRAGGSRGRDAGS